MALVVQKNWFVTKTPKKLGCLSAAKTTEVRRFEAAYFQCNLAAPKRRQLMFLCLFCHSISADFLRGIPGWKPQLFVGTPGLIILAVLRLGLTFTHSGATCFLQPFISPLCCRSLFKHKHHGWADVCVPHPCLLPKRPPQLVYHFYFLS